MTEPVNRIGGTKETGRKNSQDRISRNDRHKHNIEHNEDDRVDISEEARDKSSGKKKKSILEYIQS